MTTELVERRKQFERLMYDLMYFPAAVPQAELDVLQCLQIQIFEVERRRRRNFRIIMATVAVGFSFAAWDEIFAIGKAALALIW